MAREGTLVPDVPPYRRMAAILFPRRNESVVYFEESVDVTETLPWIDAWNARAGAPRCTLFRLLLFAASRALHASPRLNRFVSGRRLYQRDGVWLSFTAKKSMAEGAPLTVVKRRFEADETLEAFLADLDSKIAAARSDAPSYEDKELALFMKFPRLVLMFFVRVVRLLDFLNLLPRSFIRNDPFFASAFLTNLGSVGGAAGYHHLYEYGTIPLFCTLGRVQEEVVARDGAPAVRKIARLKFAYDERIEDGFNAVRGLARLRELIERPPSLLERRPTAAGQPS